MLADRFLWTSVSLALELAMKRRSIQIQLQVLLAKLSTEPRVLCI